MFSLKVNQQEMENISCTKNTLPEIYRHCIQKQLEEFDMLSSIFCSSGEIQIYDPSVISDFHEFINDTSQDIRGKLDFGIFLQRSSSGKIEIRVELPHLYPAVENAHIMIRSALFTKDQETFVGKEIENYVSTMDKSEGYVFQVLTWIQDRLDDFLQTSDSDKIESDESASVIEVERLWIYSHHIKSKTKRHEIVRNARELNLTGFSRPGKPGIICVEGIKSNTQEFWKIIKAMNWHKITLKKLERKYKTEPDIDKWRRFKGFKEEIFANNGVEEVVMDMKLFIKYLEDHNCGYITKEIFGFD